MNAAARVRAILFDPVVAWAVIEKDIGDPVYVLSRYVALLALIPALASFVGATLIGVIAPGGGIIRAGLVDGLFGAIFSYAMSCAMVLAARTDHRSFGADIRRPPRFRGRVQARGLFVHTTVARRNFSHSSGIAFSAAHRLLQHLSALARHPALNESARTTSRQFRRVDCRLRRRDALCHRARATHAVRHAGALTSRHPETASAASLEASLRTLRPFEGRLRGHLRADETHGASTMRLQAAGKPDSVNGGFGLGGMSGGIGCSVDSLNQKSSS